MEQINELITFFQVLIPLEAGARIGYCLLLSGVDEEDRTSLKTRARNAAIFAVAAEGILPFIQLIFNYF